MFKSKRNEIMVIPMLLSIFIIVCFCSKQSNHEKIKSIVFEKSIQIFPSFATFQIALADLDTDGDFDAVFSMNDTNHCRVLFNDGKGYFVDSGQQLTERGHGVGIGDLDGDGDPDVLMTCASYEHASRVYWNDGKGEFTDSGQDLGDLKKSGNAVYLHDVDGDDDLDGMIDYYEEPNVIYVNNGSGEFIDSGERYPDDTSFIDLDSDGDVDMFVCEMGNGYRTLLNDGGGKFQESGFLSDTTLIRCFTGYGDLDVDGDLDLIVTNGDRRQSFPTRILFNDGKGNFKFGDQNLTPVYAGRVGIGDLNGDNHLDVVLTCYEKPNEVWLGNGRGGFTKTLELENKGAFHTALLEDLDSDGDLDLVIAHYLQPHGSSEIWFNKKK
jgi:hypothetical protein